MRWFVIIASLIFAQVEGPFNRIAGQLSAVESQMKSVIAGDAALTLRASEFEAKLDEISARESNLLESASKLGKELRETHETFIRMLPTTASPALKSLLSAKVQKIDTEDDARSGRHALIEEMTSVGEYEECIHWLQTYATVSALEKEIVSSHAFPHARHNFGPRYTS